MKSCDLDMSGPAKASPGGQVLKDPCQQGARLLMEWIKKHTGENIWEIFGEYVWNI